MIFTETETQKYNGITPQDINDYNKREIIYQPTQSSNLETENAILTLENESIFYDEKNKFFERLKNKPEIKHKEQIFYRWLQNFLCKHQQTNKAIKYIYSKTNLSDLKEAALTIYYDETTT